MLSLSKWIGLAPSFLGLCYREKVRIADDDCVLADRLNVLHWQELATAQVADHAPAHLVAPHSTPLVHENVTHLPDLLALLGDYLGTGDRMTLLAQVGHLEVFPQLAERLLTPTTTTSPTLATEVQRNALPRPIVPPTNSATILSDPSSKTISRTFPCFSPLVWRTTSLPKSSFTLCIANTSSFLP